MRTIGVCVVLALSQSATAATVQGQTWERGEQGWCEDSWGDRERDRFCEVLTATITAPALLEVDGGRNGGVNVVGWSRPDVEVRAKVWADARGSERAEELARAVRVSAEGGRISAEGPDTERGESWGVGYEVRVPDSMDLDLRTRNGGVRVTAVRGDIDFDAVNGGVHLTDVGGDVRGRTTNGGLRVELTGDSWVGRGLDVETTNGGVRLYVPEGFDAELVTGTVNGGFDIDFPVTVSGRIGRQLRTTLGDGGPTLRLVTTNGGVRIARR